MSFLRPEFLWALPLVGLPILIHLLNRQRFVRLDFAAMEFLRRAQRRTRRRLFLEDLLLLVLRTLAVLLLVLALARPGVDPGSLLAGRSARGEVVVLDASLSMDHRADGQSAFERAAAAAAGVLGALDAGRGDQAALVRAGAVTERLAYGDPPEVLAALAELREPDPAATDLGAALAVAQQTALALLEGGCEEVRISLWSDFQATTWNLEDGRLLEVVRAIAAGGHALRLLDAGAPQRGNVAVEAIDLAPAEVAPGESALLSARIRSYERRDRRLRLSLLVDGVPAGGADLELAAGSEIVWTHPVGAAEPGTRGLEVRIDGDALATDDRRSAVLAARRPPRVLVIGESAPAGEPPGQTELLRRFLDLGAGAPLVFAEAAPARAPRELAGVDLAIVADPARLDATLREALVAHVRGGGGLLVTVGPACSAADLGALLDELGRPDLRLGEALEVAEPSARLDIVEPGHPALALFADPRWRPLLTEVPQRSFRPLFLDAGPAADGLPPAADARVALRFLRATGEDPRSDLGAALIDWTTGGARCAILAASPLPAWNAMASVPGGTLPFLLDLAVALAPRPRHARSVEAGAPLAVELPGLPAELRLDDPRGQTLRPQAEAVSLGGGRMLQPLLERALVPGIWIVSAHLLDAGGAAREHRERIAVVPPAAESDLAPLDHELLAAQLPPGVVVGEDTGDTSGRAAAPAAAPADLSWPLYLAILLLLAGETLLAAYLDRRRG